jgi:hypothetical protein
MEFDVLIFAILTTGAVLIVTQAARLLRTAILHRTVREAISRNSDAVPSLMAGIEEKPARSTDDRTGLVLLALGVAVFLFGLIQGDPDDIQNMAAISVFPLLVGAALLGRYVYRKRQGEA